MNNTIYIKGDPGFKAAILQKLGGTWLHGVVYCDEDKLGFAIPEDILLEDFKSMIGYTTIVSYSLHFLDKLLGDTFSEIPPKFVPGKPIKMSIWANNKL
jgi:hypothetical protein